MKSAILVLLCTLALSSAAPPKESTKQLTRAEKEDYRLDKTVLPSHYDISLRPYFNNEGERSFTFDGIVKMVFAAQGPSIRQITFHAHELEINHLTEQIYETNIPETRVTIESWSLDNETHKYTLNLASELNPARSYTYEATYVGLMKDDMHGFYRSSYVDSMGQTKWIGTTQMQPVHARRVFPCFDEPLFKATFVIRMDRPTSYKTTVGNTRCTSVEQGDRTIDTFETTPRMSTYLLAFIVSEFESNIATDRQMTVISRQEAISQTNYAIEVGPKLLAALSDFYDYDYYSTINKMHMAAIPDFSAGAMENWGLLTYRETALLYDSQESTSMAQQRVATVITHEQAHMWFGDLVTCEWWSVTWLNEGFARYFQYFGTALVEKTWGLDLQFVVEQLQAVFGTDATTSINALTSDTYTPSDISVKFNTISYNKGASVIRMVQHIMGETPFRDALRQYLKENAYDVATPELLYKALQAQANEQEFSVSDFLETWTKQPGYPLVTASLQNDSKTINLTQKRFILKDVNTATTEIWHVPLTVADSASRSFVNTKPGSNYLSESSKTVELTQQVDWFILNVQQTGYYRVNYDDNNWDKLAAALKQSDYSGIHVLNRGQIVDDILTLARAGVVDYTRAFKLIEYLENETEYNPWLAAFNNLAYVFRRIDDEALLDAYIQKLTRKIYENLTFDKGSSDNRLRVYNRVNVMSHNCKHQNSGCINAAKQAFGRLQVSLQNKVEVDSRATVYCTAIREGGQDEFDFLWTKFLGENVAAEQVLILSSLGCTKDKDRIIDYIGKILGASVRLQDKSAAFSATYTNNQANVEVVLDYMIANYKAVATGFGESLSDVATIFSGLADRFSKQSQIDKLEKFYNDNKAEFTNQASTFVNALDNAKYNQQWSEKHVKAITDYIKEYNSGSAVVASLFMVFLAALISLFNQ